MAAIALGVLVSGGCGKDSAPPAPADDEPAGEVLELQGTVTAELTTGGETKTRGLSVGDRVFARETIITGADASVTIRLFHNNAKWTLGADKRREVRQSAAWKAPREGGGDLLASSGDDQTAAAGRHAEREAADTRATAQTETSAVDSEAPAEGEMAKEEAPARKASRRSGRGADSEPADRRAALEKEVADKGVLKVLGTSGGESGGSVADVLGDDGDLDEAFDGVGLKGTGRGGGGTGEGTVGVGMGTIGHGSGTGSGYGTNTAHKPRSAAGPRLTLTSVSAKNGLDSAIVRRILRRDINPLKQCYATARSKDETLAGKLVVEFSIDEKGKVTAVEIGGDAKLAGAVRACVTSRIRGLAFPAAEGKKTAVVATLTLGVTK